LISSEYINWPRFSKKDEEYLLESLSNPSNEKDSFIQRFNKAFAQYNNVKNCFATSNGTVSLEIALEALGIGFHDEVIIPGLTWLATANAVLNVNAIPVLADIEPNSLCIDPKEVENAITDNTRAIIPVHLYCTMAKMDKLLKLASNNEISIIEDAAHVHGAEWRGKKAGTLGDIGCFSMQKSKVLTCGEGGAVITNRDDLQRLLLALHDNGRSKLGDGYSTTIHGNNYRISEHQAAILLAQLELLDVRNSIRNNNAKLFDDAVKSIPGLELFKPNSDMNRREFYYYIFRYNSKEFNGFSINDFKQALEEKLNFKLGKIYPSLNKCSYYNPTLKSRHRICKEYIKRINYCDYQLPISELACEEYLLFHHSILLQREEYVYEIIDILREVCENLN